MDRVWIGCGALAGLLAVALAAIGAHAGLAPAAREMLESGVQMQGWHGLALLSVGLWRARGGWLADLAGGCFVAGILLFCAGVYGAALGSHLGLVAPTGGWLLMAGWLALGLSALRR